MSADLTPALRSVTHARSPGPDLRGEPRANYLACYPASMSAQVRQLIMQNRLADLLLQEYPLAHHVRTDKALYDYVLGLKNEYLRNTGQLNRVSFDSKMHIVHNTLGSHTTIPQVQGANLRNRREIRVASIFKEGPPEFLRMIVVHELAHLKEREHSKAFYQLCRHMEPDYAQLEFDLRSYLTYLDGGGTPLWPAPRLHAEGGAERQGTSNDGR